MSRDENLERLRAATSGRIAMSMQALPYVFMAPIRLVEREGADPTVVVTVDSATTNLDALERVVVAIHTDGTDHDGGHWEVLVQGLSTSHGDGTSGPVNEASVGADVIRGWRTILDPAALDNI